MFKVPTLPLNIGSITALGFVNEKKEHIVHVHLIYKGSNRKNSTRNYDAIYEVTESAVKKLNINKLSNFNEASNFVFLTARQKLDEPRFNSYKCPCHPNYPVNSDNHDDFYCRVHLVAGVVLNAAVAGKKIESLKF